MRSLCFSAQFADSELQKHRCNQCGSEYKQKYSLTFHQRHECGKDPQPSGERPSSLTSCVNTNSLSLGPTWPLNTRQTSSNAVPMCFYVETQQKFACICGRVYKQKTGLQQHQRLECGKEPQFACHLCSYKAKRKTSLNSHLLFKHKLEKDSVQ
ncbi:hypothetical protein J6590_014803 [Homalodisca vitripennis]|nr:hypothetical protein J6590_014803 [Homalodisca vitripennis]